MLSKTAGHGEEKSWRAVLCKAYMHMCERRGSHAGRFNSGRADPIIYRTEGWEGFEASPSALEKKEVTSVCCDRTAMPHQYIYTV